jgi:carboxymethylenebutenolidase
MVVITTDSGTMPAYAAYPAGETKAAVIVIQEIFGVNAGIRQKVDTLAALGYHAIAPDLFCRINDATDLDPDVKPEFEQALDLMHRFDQQQGVADLAATIAWLRAGGAGVKMEKVGCVGYCLGGRLAYLCAARTDVDASVGYYAVGIDGLLSESDAIANPLMLHIPTADHFVDPAAQAAMHAGLGPHPRITMFDYPGLDHGFAAETGQRRHEDGAQLADRRTMAFFKEHLSQ